MKAIQEAETLENLFFLLLVFLFLFVKSSSVFRQIARVFCKIRKPTYISYTIKAQSEVVIENLPQAKVQYVFDGDTIGVSKGWFNFITIRLDAIDCPENGQDWGDTAKYGLIKMIGGRKVRFEEHGRDCYGRTLATLYIKKHSENKWLNVNERMITLGHAWVLRQFYDHLPKERQNKLNALETWAKSKKVGLWNTANPIPPWNWRKHNK
jgi:endonuclease YncB( thermonuclease family)